LDENALIALEFPRVLQLLSAETATPPGTALALEVQPCADPVEVERENHLTAEATRYLQQHGNLPFGTLTDPLPLIDRLKLDGTTLEPPDIIELLGAMKSGRSLKSALTEARSAYPRLWELACALPDLGNLVRFLDGKIAISGEILDHASDDLRSLRRDLQRRAERLQVVLDGITGRPEVARILQDDFVSIRSDRHVIPIRSEARQALPGIVHGVSGSGATVFLEPLETVDLNNEIVTLRDRESAEVHRLLREYSDLLRGRLPELRALRTAIGRIDLVMARARLARSMGAHPAPVEQTTGLRLTGARHPLVEISLRAEGGRIVPLDLALSSETHVLMISGPNTGGKTVALKTVGLLALMHQSGLAIPADEVHLPVFRSIFIDIGDRQSISARLSTFSARIKSIADIAKGLQPPALVLLDEIGTGTDPEEGVALGIATVDYLRQRDSTVIATTHLEALKAYAASTEQCTNAAMQFDEETFVPTYRLVAGIPGRSGALEIAARLGLPRSILEAARARRNRSGADISEYLARLQTLTSELEERRIEVQRELARLAADRAAMEKEAAEREERRRTAMVDEIKLALASIREEGERYLGALKDREVAQRMRKDEARAAARVKAEARRLIRQVAGTAGRDITTGGTIATGSSVFVRPMGVRGKVEQVRGNRVVVVVRGKKLTVERDDCEAEPDRIAAKPALPTGISLQRRSSEPSGEIHLLGLTVDDALQQVDKFLDDAFLSDINEVRLIHGIGSGKLKRAITHMLKDHPHVESFSSAVSDHGGAGVTLVTLRT
jgi:DNA mismatch repair protein MutS2